MTELKKNGVAARSRYAAKKAALAASANKENATDVAQVANTEEAIAPTDSAQAPIRKNKKAGFPDTAKNYPEHYVNIALLIKNNAEIRRFTALGILNYLLQKGEIRGDHRYVTFKWNKFAVKCNGLMREYSYNEPFFLNALVASFSSFSASAQRTIDAFCHKEMSVGITKAVDQDDVDNIVELNERNINSSIATDDDASADVD